MVLELRIFKGMESFTDCDMEKICNRLRYALWEKEVSYQRAARELGVSRDLLFNYTSPDYSENSMKVETLKRLAEYFEKEMYYFCNEYHRFLDTADVKMLLQKIKKEQNMTRKQLADHLGISFASYKSYERGKCKIPREVFELIKKETKWKTE